MDHHFAQVSNRPLALAKAAEMSLSSVQRILAADDASQADKSVAPTVDKLEDMATAFEIAPYQLLIPGLDPRNPQVLRELTETEKLLYKRLMRAEEKLALYETGNVSSIEPGERTLRQAKDSKTDKRRGGQ